MDYFGIFYEEQLLKNIEVYLRLVISALLGMFIGWDRSAKNKPAGLKTFTYVSVSCTLITIISIYSAEAFGGSNFNNRMDPMRLTAQIVSGLGFLGAGLILKDGLRVKGLTSAAMVFFAGGVGIGIGSGFYGIVFAAVFTTFVFTKISQVIEDKHSKGEQGDGSSGVRIMGQKR
ncbi:MgtC/SapB family protein [Neobacillus niacini]|uniref:MgtC/SapB family protein n=1 Tax=Neobacillus niacini TaxID=86668 RepID=UPI00052FB430|nr:MgtC/SapB family protein [Neobacillus niacini]KGM44571.1 membrane protein [Neobacillus niacini]MEC1524489.1 MgtC/SapB family protein [Neobacillus niacini]